MTIEQWIQLLVPVGSVFLVIVSASLTYYFSIKLKIKTNQREAKEKFYMSLISMISKSMISDEKEYIDDVVIALNNIPLVSSSEVAINLEKYKKYTSRQNIDQNVNTANEIYTNLLKSIRKDLYGDKINKGFPIITMQGNKGDGTK